MSDLYAKVSDSELKILKLLWRQGREMKLPEIRKALLASLGWEAVMVKTLLYRLVDKGVIKADKREVYYYSPRITEVEYNNGVTGDFVEKVYDGSAKSLVASLIDTNRLTDEDIAELRAMLKAGDE